MKGNRKERKRKLQETRTELKRQAEYRPTPEFKLEIRS